MSFQLAQIHILIEYEDGCDEKEYKTDYNVSISEFRFPIHSDVFNPDIV